jgi:hypothetical protein
MTTYPLHGILAAAAPLDEVAPTAAAEPEATALVRLDPSWRLIDRTAFAVLGWAAGQSVLVRRVGDTLRVRGGASARAGEVRSRLDARGRLCVPRHLRDALGLRDANIDRFVNIALRAGGRTIALWPTHGLRGMDGTPDQMRQRLSALWPPDESALHHAETVAMLDLALKAQPTPRTLHELIDRVGPAVTAKAYEVMVTEDAQGRQNEARRFVPAQWNSVSLRLRALAATTGTALDSNAENLDLAGCDAAWISIPGTRAPQAAADIATWLLGMLAELATEPRGRRTLVILDEFSAIGHDDRASRAAAGLIERTRSAGMAIVLGTQTTASLGEAAPRILQTAGTVITHRNPAPEDVVSLAGTEWTWEDTHDVDALGIRHATSGRRQQTYRADPQRVRELAAGEAVVIHGGGWAHVAVTSSRR